jgi:hypothetical protein
MVIINPDHDCCAKNAMLNSANAYETGTCGTSITAGIMAALMPRTSFRARLSDRPLRSKRLEHQPPMKLPMPDAAYGIHA